jgi:hypothetical protein
MFHVKQSLQTSIQRPYACETAMAVSPTAWIPMIRSRAILGRGNQTSGSHIGARTATHRVDATEGESFVSVDRLGRDLSPAADWLDAERTLDEDGIGHLADPFELLLEDGTWQQVWVVEAFPHGDPTQEGGLRGEGGPRVEYTRPFPAPGTLRTSSAGGSGQ